MAVKLPQDLDISGTQPFGKPVLDRAFAYIVQRFLLLETFKPSYQDAVDRLNAIGLDRIRDVLQPVFEAYSQIASLGAIFSAVATESHPVAMGPLSITVDAAYRNQFAPARWVSVMVSDASAAMAGLVIGFDRTTGILNVQVLETYGSGTYASWQISPTSPPLLAAAVVDGGVYDAGSVSNTQIPYLYSGPSVVSQPTDGGAF